MALQTPELLLEKLNNALRHLRGACTELGSEEVDAKLQKVMRRLLLAEVLGNTWIVAIGGSQGAGKTTLVACMYELRGDGPQWLQGNEGRGEKMPVLVLEENGLQKEQGYVRRLVRNEKTMSFALEDVPVDIADFQRAVCDPSTEDLLPVLRVPQRYFKRDNQAWLLLPGYEKQDRENQEWQELMRQAMVAAGGCIVVTDSSRMASQHHDMVKDALKSELEGIQPYIVISKTEDIKQNSAAQAQLRANAQAMFQIESKAIERIILTGVDDPEYVAEWMPHLQHIIDDLNFAGKTHRSLQISHLSDLIGKDLTQVLGLIRRKSRLYFESEDLCDGEQVLQSILGKFDDSVEALRVEHTNIVNKLAEETYVKAQKELNDILAKEHEGFRNWLSNAFDTTSEARLKLHQVVQDSWKSGARQLFEKYSHELANLTARKLGKIDEEPNALGSKQNTNLIPPSLIKVGYMYKSGQLVQFKNLTPEKVSDIRMLLGHSSQQEAHSTPDTSKSLGMSVELVPVVTLEYTRLLYALPEVVGLKEFVMPECDKEADHGNIVQNGIHSFQESVDLGRTAIKSLAAVMAVDVVSNGEADILNAIFGRTESSDSPSVPDDPSIPVIPTLHPVAVAATAVVAGAYLTSVAVTRMRKFEKAASEQARSMLASVHDHHVKHLEKQFDDVMAASRAKVAKSIQARYRIDETLMRKDRLAKAMADARSLTSDIRHELYSAAVGINPFSVEPNA